MTIFIYVEFLEDCHSSTAVEYCMNLFGLRIIDLGSDSNVNISFYKASWKAKIKLIKVKVLTHPKLDLL